MCEGRITVAGWRGPLLPYLFLVVTHALLQAGHAASGCAGKAVVDDARRSVDPVSSTGAVDGFEGSSSALVKDTLRLQALVLVVTVGGHAGTELGEVLGAQLAEDILAGTGLILTSEAVISVRLPGALTR